MTHFGTVLSDYKEKVIAELDASAETHRQNFITVGAGMALAYMMKMKEAELYLSSPSKDLEPTDFPHLYREAKESNMSMHLKAKHVIENYNKFNEVSAKIEVVRLEKKAAIRAAKKPAELIDIMNFDWNEVVSV